MENSYSELSDLTIPNLSYLYIDLDFKQKKSKKRKLTDDIFENYKLTIKDKYGKIMSIFSDSEDIMIKCYFIILVTFILELFIKL